MLDGKGSDGNPELKCPNFYTFLNEILISKKVSVVFAFVVLTGHNKCAMQF